MRLAVAQVNVSQHKDENLAKAKALCLRAKNEGADLLLLPEVFMAYIPPHASLRAVDVAEPMNGFFVEALCALAMEYQLYVVVGILERSEEEQTRVHNSILLINRKGEILHRYRKTHLYDAFSMQESKGIIPSNNALKPVMTEFGSIGLAVCYELRFPEIIRTLTIKGAELILVPTAWINGPNKEAHLLTVSRCRALENTVFLAVSDHCGHIYTGRSIIYDPLGETLATIGQSEGLIYAEIDREVITRVRRELPCINQRRPELYQL